VAIDPQAHGLPGNGNAYYDRAFSRWLPVGRQAVTADGKHYAFSEPAADQAKNPKIHVVDVTTGADRVFETPSQTWFIAYGVLDFSGDGIYLVQAYESPMFGLWLLNPTTGAMTEVAHLDYIEGSAGNKIFWLGYVDPTDNHNVGTLFSYADQLDRYNIADGSRTPWLHQPGKGISLVAIDAAGHPLVALISSLQSQDAIWALVLLPGPNMQRQIIEARADFVSSLSSSITDGHGVWFGSRQGIYLYSEGGGLQKVSNQPGYPANGCF